MNVQKDTEWTVGISGKIKKQKDKLPPDVLLLFAALHKELTLTGRCRQLGRITANSRARKTNCIIAT